MWIGEGFALIHDGTKWNKCADRDIVWETNPPRCKYPQDFSDSMDSLSYDEQIDRKQVNLNRWVDDGEGGGYNCSYRNTESGQFSLVNERRTV